MVREPLRGYVPDPIKRILVVSLQNVPQAEAVFRGYGLQIFTGCRYLRDFGGSKAAQDRWPGDKVEVWQDSGATLSGVVRRHPQTAYAGLQKSLQQEWYFVQRVTLDISMEFQAVEDVLHDIFLPDLFQGATSQIPGGVDHWYAGQTGRYHPSRPNSDHGGVLDGVLSDHWVPRHGAHLAFN